MSPLSLTVSSSDAPGLLLDFRRAPLRPFSLQYTPHIVTMGPPKHGHGTPKLRTRVQHVSLERSRSEIVDIEFTLAPKQSAPNSGPESDTEAPRRSWRLP